MKHNAMTDAAKQQRRSDFIATARQLFSATQSLPTVADIASAAGLAKGTVYRYFHSKEEIFIALLQDDFQALFSALKAQLATLPGDNIATAQSFAGLYCAQIQRRPTLLPLAAMLNAVLEQNLPPPVLRQFKQLLATALDQLGQALAQRVTAISAADASQLLLHTYGLTLGLWQTLHYPAAVQALLQSAPELSTLQRDFATELEQAVRQLWLGALG
ncbi:MAG: TetR family transcriptional regulator [Rheinheimera sp.]|nr:TetR family transcriptional regulator [Rheinheimera sp.]